MVERVLFNKDVVVEDRCWNDIDSTVKSVITGK